MAADQRWFPVTSDNSIPFIFANQLRHGHILKPMMGDWHASDRPPLQTGIYLLFGIPGETFYQTLATWLQASSLLPVLVLMRGAGSRLFRAALFWVLATGSFYLQNSEFVWPKLLAASYSLVAYCLLFELGGFDLDRRLRVILIGLSVSMSLLAHGGAVFALPGMVVCTLLWKRTPSMKEAFVALAVCVLLLTPWTLFQKFADPPGDRLLKWHLAGLIGPDEKISFAKALGHAYSGLTLHQWWQGKEHGLWLVFSGFYRFPEDTWRMLVKTWPVSQFVATVEDQSFSGTSYTLWFLAPALIGALAYTLISRKRGRRDPLDFHYLLAATFISLATWILVLFTSNSALIHQGAYFNNIALCLAAGWIIHQFSRYLYWFVIAANSMLTAWIYVPLRLQNESVRSYLIGVIVLAILFASSCWMAADQREVREPVQLPRMPE